jgi:glycosyltransferase involved in cell wall biosynthesis
VGLVFTEQSAAMREGVRCAVISVVLPVRDGMPWLGEQLEALAGQECEAEWEVVVADNGSTDDGPALVREWAAQNPRLRLIDASERPGPAAARNIGVQSARGELVAFCDADDVVAPAWLAGCATTLDRADVVAGSFDFGSLNGRGPSTPQPAATRQLGFLPGGLGANLAVRRNAFEAVGGFAEELRIGEDIDLCWRLQLRGYRFAHAPEAVVAKRDHPETGRVFRHGLAFGRSAPELYLRHRAEGARPDLLGAARSWLWLLVHLPDVVREGAARNTWVHAAGMRIGRLQASARLRVFFP